MLKLIFEMEAIYILNLHNNNKVSVDYIYTSDRMKYSEWKVHVFVNFIRRMLVLVDTAQWYAIKMVHGYSNCQHRMLQLCM